MCQVPQMEPVSFARPYEVYDSEQVVVDGRIVKKTVIKTVVPSEQFKGLKCSDFALDNIIAAGAVDMLRPTQLTNTDLDCVDR